MLQEQAVHCITSVDGVYEFRTVTSRNSCVVKYDSASGTSANAGIDTVFQENKELITLKNPSAQAHECLLNELTGINMGWSSQKCLEVMINLGYLSKDPVPSDFEISKTSGVL